MELHLSQLEFDRDHQSTGFCIGGGLWLSFGDASFPEENWYDMVYTVLKYWLPGLCSFARNHTDTCVLEFMDGPYSVHMRRICGRICASCLRDHVAVISDRELDFPVFLKSVLHACRQYDRFLYENGEKQLFSSEIIELKRILDTYDLGENHV